jgi:hypothetical protein
MNGARGHLSQYTGTMDCLKGLGTANLYRGVHIFAIKELLTAFAQLSIYEAMF